MKVHLTKDEACDTLDKICELFPACRGELQEIKQFVKHSKYKGRKTMSDLAWKISKLLPVYIDLSTMKRILGPKTQGYTLAIWNCGSYESLWSIMRDVRITIRKDGMLYRTIKNGYV